MWESQGHPRTGGTCRGMSVLFHSLRDVAHVAGSARAVPCDIIVFTPSMLFCCRCSFCISGTLWAYRVAYKPVLLLVSDPGAKTCPRRHAHRRTNEHPGRTPGVKLWVWAAYRLRGINGDPHASVRLSGCIDHSSMHTSQLGIRHTAGPIRHTAGSIRHTAG